MTDAVATLAVKLAGMELTVQERAVLDALLDRAASAPEPEVEGFGVVYEIETKDHDARPIDAERIRRSLGGGLLSGEFDAGRR